MNTVNDELIFQVKLQSEKLSDNPCINPNKMDSKHPFIWAMDHSPSGEDAGFVCSLLHQQSASSTGTEEYRVMSLSTESDIVHYFITGKRL